MAGQFDKFVQEENIRYFKAQLATETEPVRRVLLWCLLQEEEELQRHRIEAESKARPN